MPLFLGVCAICVLETINTLSCYTRYNHQLEKAVMVVISCRPTLNCGQLEAQPILCILTLSAHVDDLHEHPNVNLDAQLIMKVFCHNNMSAIF